MVLNNVPPLTETRARPAMRFSSSNYTYSIWIQIMQFKLSLPARLTLQFVLTEKPYPRISESPSRLQGGDGESCPCHLLHALWARTLFSHPWELLWGKGGEFPAGAPCFMQTSWEQCHGVDTWTNSYSDSPWASYLGFTHRRKSRMRLKPLSSSRRIFCIDKRLVCAPGLLWPQSLCSGSQQLSTQINNFPQRPFLNSEANWCITYSSLLVLLNFLSPQNRIAFPHLIFSLVAAWWGLAVRGQNHVSQHAQNVVVWTLRG